MHSRNEQPCMRKASASRRDATSRSMSTFTGSTVYIGVGPSSSLVGARGFFFAGTPRDLTVVPRSKVIPSVSFEVIIISFPQEKLLRPSNDPE